MDRKNKEDRYCEKIVLFLTAAQKEKLQLWCSDHGTDMSKWARQKIEALK